ncbi:MAG: peptide chain release factor N(5)-glutamine methyltransferase [Patescibacteria group bacterium]|nr:peptide chain release factor N(5)-glutamine methyltransferase [Patescibacteria group bacterium]
MTIKEKTIETKEKLLENGIENYILESETIISLALKKDRLFLITNSQKKLKENENKKINKIIEQRLKLYPLAYISGKKNFYNSEFEVNKDTLIPRPESELIIEEIIKKEEQNKNGKIFIDVGTGSGCLIISLAKILQNNKKNCFYGLDICPKALKVAKKNTKKNNLNKKINFYQSNLLEKIIKINNKNNFLNNKNLIIIANLPYLTKEEISKSPTIKFEPKKALYGGLDGLNFYRKMLKQVKKLKEDNKIKAEIHMEISPWQKNILVKDIKNILKNIPTEIKTIKDLNRKNRLIVLKV